MLCHCLRSLSIALGDGGKKQNKDEKIGSYRIIVVNSGTLSVDFRFILRRSTGGINSDGLKRGTYHLVNRKTGIFI